MESRITKTEISLRVADADAKAEASFSMPNAYTYSDVEDLRDDDYTADNITTLEQNLFVLDGSAVIPASLSAAVFGVWSAAISDADGSFTANPTLTATTANSYTTAGITLTFWGDTWPKQTVTTWYSGTAVLASQTDTCTGFTHFIDKTVEGFNKVTIELVGTDTPYRRIKLSEIDFGQIFVWSGDGIISASILEEVNLTSEELTINTLELSVHDEDSDFNMLNASGVYAELQQKQQLRVTEYLNGSRISMGYFYLDTWENTSSVVAKFTAYDIVGVLDTVTYQESAMWSGATVATIAASILGVAGVTKYSIDSSIAALTLSGYIPVCTCREALHYLCFAARASCISARDGSLIIKRLPSSDAVNAIEKSQKSGSQSIKQNTLVNSVAVTAYTWALGTSSSQLYSATLAVGTYNITFSTPAASLSISGGTITASGINYAVVSVTTAGTVTITGYQYASSTTVYTVEADGLTDAKRSQATVDSIYLIGTGNAADVAQFVYDDYQSRIVQTFDLTLEDEAVGDNVDVDTMLGARKTGVITSLDIDLTGGFIATCEVRG